MDDERSSPGDKKYAYLQSVFQKAFDLHQTRVVGLLGSRYGMLQEILE